MHRFLRLFRRRRSEAEWLPLPYDQAIRVPEPPRPDYRHALTPDGQRLAVLEPAPPPAPSARVQRREAMPRLRKRIGSPRKAMRWDEGW